MAVREPHRPPAARRTAARGLGALTTGLLLAAGLWVGPSVTAHAEGTAATFAVEASLAPDGKLSVEETITFAGAAPARVSQKFETRQDLVGDRQYVQTLSGVTATVGGAPAVPEVSSDGRFTTVEVATDGASEMTIAYDVAGATVNLDNGETALRWGLLQGLSAAVTTFTATVQIPGAFSYVKCTAGSPNSTVPCRTAAGGSENARTPVFGDGPRGEGEVVVVDIGFPAGSVTANEVLDRRWTLGGAFSAAPLPLGLALGLLALGGLALALAHRRTGTDAHAGGEVARVAQFVPTGAGQSEFRVADDIRPGQVGTVADERVDPIDVTATLVDLAVRGHLLITELPRDSAFAPPDWDLTRRSGGDALQPFEQALLDGIAPVGGDVRVSQVAGRVRETISGVQDRLYDEVVERGWYERRPDATRSRSTTLALAALVVAVLVTVALAAFTTFGLVGLALVILALGFIFVAQELPSRTAKGSALLAGLDLLRTELAHQPTDQMPPGREVEEMSRLLPYAIVLGGSERWLAAIVAADADADADATELSWFHGPADWHLRDLPDSLRNFITNVTGTLFAR